MKPPVVQRIGPRSSKAIMGVRFPPGGPSFFDGDFTSYPLIWLVDLPRAFPFI